jgi:hypothetical protein
VTVALFNIRLTVASATPAVPLRADCTRLWQAAQCIPETGIVIFFDMGRILYTPHPYVNLVDRDVSRAEGRVAAPDVRVALVSDQNGNL